MTDAIPVAMSASTGEELQGAIVDMMAKYHVPGATAAVIHDQELIWSAGFGLADVERGRPATADTVFRCASVTKPFTATAIMKLRDQGRLSLDDPLVRHIPEFRQVKNPFGAIEDITLRKLVSHHSGLQSEAPFDYWDTLEFPSIEEILKSLPKARVAIPPDSAFKYCNLGFILLGETIARLSGRKYHEYVTDNILHPLAMSMSGYVPTAGMSAALATGYEPNPHSDRPSDGPHTSLNGRMPAGGLYSTANDLARWLSLQFRTDHPADGREQVVSGATLAEMHRPIYTSPAWDTAYCVSWQVLIRQGASVHYHGGGLPAYSTMTAFEKMRKIGAVVLTNLGGHDGAKEAAVRLIDIARSSLTTGQTPGAAVPVPVPENLRCYLGVYRGRGAQQEQIGWREGRLMLLPPAAGASGRFGPAELRPGPEPNTLLVKEGRAAGELARFEIDAAGDPVAFRLAATVYRKLRQQRQW